MPAHFSFNSKTIWVYTFMYILRNMLRYFSQLRKYYVTDKITRDIQYIFQEDSYVPSISADITTSHMYGCALLEALHVPDESNVLTILLSVMSIYCFCFHTEIDISVSESNFSQSMGSTLLFQDQPSVLLELFVACVLFLLEHFSLVSQEPN